MSIVERLRIVRENKGLRHLEDLNLIGEAADLIEHLEEQLCRRTAQAEHFKNKWEESVE